jgi:S-methylmethionine-dependent homocysteine/selenocysteine methylase
MFCNLVLQGLIQIEVDLLNLAQDFNVLIALGLVNCVHVARIPSAVATVALQSWKLASGTSWLNSNSTSKAKTLSVEAKARGLGACTPKGSSPP